MGITIGPFDPIQLNIEILNVLIRKGQISIDEADEILKRSMPNLPEEQKQRIIESLKGGANASAS